MCSGTVSRLDLKNAGEADGDRKVETVPLKELQPLTGYGKFKWQRLTLGGYSMTKRFWTCALMTLLSAGVSAGFSLEGLVGPGGGDSFARYAASRSVALLLTVLIAICLRSRTATGFLGIAMTVVQAFDGVIGALAHDPLKTYGPFVFAVLNALVVGWLLRGQESHPNKPVTS
ncbi:MAG TPA: hypothetical protein VGY66_31645 [Gemmataceae bacterium]|nr:hypothetical protein [Gemmataceae bacterium]